VATSFVPRGGVELALEDATRAEVVEEPIVMGAEAEIGEIARGEARTPSRIDRSVEPPYGTPPELTAPAVWRTELANGLPVLGIEDREVPLVSFRLVVRGGQMVEDPAAPVGVANLLAESMTAGTATRTPEELEKAIDLLGASIDVQAGPQTFVISGSTLSRNFDDTMELVQEILLEPRFDEAEFTLSQQRVRNGLRQRSASPVALASDVFRRLLYGEHVLAANPLGDPETIDEISLDDLREYHRRALAPGVAALHVTGDVAQAEVVAALDRLSSEWSGEGPSAPAAPAWDPDRAGLYFVDVPDASQSVLNIGYLALAETDEDFYPATVMNFRLGGGGFASELTQVLREQRGYTYGIRSGFDGTGLPGPFQIASSVRSNVTYEALDAIKAIVESHGRDFDATDLDATRSFLLRANARSFETAGAKLGILGNMSAYGFPADYVLQREGVVREMTVQEIQALARRYLDTGAMAWLVVGDAATQLPRLRALGLGEPTMLDREGVPIGP
jgi:zinc protease